MPRKRRRRKPRAEQRSKKHERAVELGLIPSGNSSVSVKDVVSSYDSKYNAGTWSGKPIEAGTYTGGGTGQTWRSKNCTHWKQKVELDEGIVIRCSAYSDRPWREGWVLPEIGIYFADSWASTLDMATPAWAGPDLGTGTHEIAVMGWPDYGVPESNRRMWAVLEYALNEAGKGREVEIGCIGGHGRTGTALAAMLIMLGRPAQEAMDWVWKHYCYWAIESQSQEAWLRATDKHFNGHLFEVEEEDADEKHIDELMNEMKEDENSGVRTTRHHGWCDLDGCDGCYDANGILHAPNEADIPANFLKEAYYYNEATQSWENADGSSVDVSDVDPVDLKTESEWWDMIEADEMLAEGAISVEEWSQLTNLPIDHPRGWRTKQEIRKDIDGEIDKLLGRDADFFSRGPSRGSEESSGYGSVQVPDPVTSSWDSDQEYLRNLEVQKRTNPESFIAGDSIDYYQGWWNSEV